MMGKWKLQFHENILSVQMIHIVVFENTKEVEVVSSSWINNGTCMWPPNKSEVSKAVKSRECPGNGWKPYKARIIFTSAKLNFVISTSYVEFAIYHL